MKKKQSSLNYYGFVTINVLNNNKVVKTIRKHNSGTEWLFKVLASTLCGNNESTNMPRYFDIGTFNKTQLGNTFVTSLVSRIALSSKTINNFSVSVPGTTDNHNFKGIVGASFSALISASDILQNSLAPILRLYSDVQGESSLLAQVNLGDEAITLDYSSGYNYMVEWVMTFENALNEE